MGRLGFPPEAAWRHLTGCAEVTDPAQCGDINTAHTPPGYHHSHREGNLLTKPLRRMPETRTLMQEANARRL